VAEGHAESAPEKPRLWLKAAITTVLASAVWGVIYWVIASGMISLREG
jgi:predicted secreted protein